MRKIIVLAISVMFMSASIFGQIIYNNNDPGDPSNPDKGLANSLGTGVGGADESVLQTITLGMNTLGFGHQVIAAQNTIADDFTLTAPTTITSATVFAYQTGSSTTSTIIGVYVRIWDGPPGMVGSNIVFGDYTTNRLISTTWSNIYRVTESSMGTSSARPIMEVNAAINIALPAGTYWLDWGCEGSLASGPWAPPLTINGSAATGDGLQALDNGVTFNPATDSGLGTPPQGFPFCLSGVTGTVPLVPTMGEWGLIILGLSFLIIGVVAVRYRRREKVLA